MKWKKSWFAYTVWAVYSVSLCLIAAIYINWLCNSQRVNKYATVGVVCVSFAAAAGLFLLFRLAYEKWGTKVACSRHTKTMLEVFAVLSLFTGAVLIRVNSYLINGAVCTGTQEYYEAAFVKAGGTVPFIRHGASYLYTCVLTVVFSFFGNKQAVGIALQIVLQLLGILCFYFAVRRLAGKREAVLSLAVMTFSEAMVNYQFSLTAENLYFFLYAGMFLLLSVYKSYEEKGRKTWLVLVSLLGLGLGTGYLVYLDFAGILFFAAVFYVILSKKRKKGKNITYLCFEAGGFLIGLSGLFLREAAVNKTTFLNTAVSWGKLYLTDWKWNFAVAGPDVTFWGNLFCLLASMWVFLAFFRKKEDDSGLYMFSLVGIAVLVSFGKPNMNYQLLATTYWSVLAAIGVTSVMTGKKEEPMKTMKKEKEEDTLVIESLEEEPENRIHFIENPLPLPKKHVKKTMDYAFEPEAELMKFDKEVSVNDDFDLA